MSLNLRGLKQRGMPGGMIAVELQLLLRRPRTWVSLAILVALPTVIAGFVAATHIAPRPGQGPALLSEVLANGTLFAAVALVIDMVLLLPLSVLVVAGDSVAGEASAGTLRYLLVRPVGRSRFLVAKLVAIFTYVLVAVVTVAISGLIVGNLFFEASGEISSISGGPPISQQGTTLRIVLAVLYVGVSMLGVAAFALFLSTLTDAPLAAALGGFAVLVASTALDPLDAAASIRPYLPTHYWLSFVDLFRNPILWRDIERGLLLQAVLVIVLLGASWAMFTTKDITS
jgi:ABC-2 type transport system permease protein